MTPPPQVLPASKLTAVFIVCCVLALAQTARADDLVTAPQLAGPDQLAPAAPPAEAAATNDEAPIVDMVSPPPVEDPREELSTIDVRLWQLRREARAQLIAPLALVVVGYGASLIGVAGAFTTFDYAEQVQHREEGDRWRERLDVNNDGSIDGSDESAFRRMAHSFAVIGLVGTAIGVVGTVFLVKGFREHADDAAEARALRQRRRQLRRELEYGANAYPGGLALSLRARF